jgi:DNA-binding Xre family transcriptional regulator
MAQRWSFKEDYIICKYCVEQEGYCWLGDKEVFEMMERLHEAGFTARSENMVLRRAKQYQELIWTGESHYATQQVRDIAEAMGNPQMQEVRQAVKRMIQKNYETFENDVELIEEGGDLLSFGDLNSSGMSQYICEIDKTKTISALLYHYLEIKRLKNRDVYRKIYMKADTFSKILSGKNDSVKKENVMKLCIGLELTLEQAKEFMASESYDFSPSKMLDVVIKSCLYHRIYNPVCVNIELAENGEPEFFVKAKEKKKKKK